jgi:surface antigen
MQQTFRFVPLLAALLLAGCSSAPNADMRSQPVPIQATPTALPIVEAPPATPVVVAANAQTAGDASAFIDPSAYSKLSGGDRAEAASAQFNALTFGRPGAPRNWGKGTTTGAITVGPYVRVNNTDCRNFTHVVTVSGTAFSKQGTACKDDGGNWTVAG